MIFSTLGHIQNNVYNLGLTECPIFLLDTPTPVIFDAGISCAVKLYAEGIRLILGERQPAVLFLTHVHWDHCGAVSYLKNSFPQMKVAASYLAVDILKRPNALALISRLNENMLDGIRSTPGLDPSFLNDEPFSSFEIDIKLQDRRVINLGEGTVIEVLATPGHTQDHMSFYLPSQETLIAGEAAGVYYGPETVSTEFVSNYDAYLSSLQRLSTLPIEVFCQGHYQHLLGRDEISAFFKRSIYETMHFKTRVLDLLEQENGLIERVIQRVKAERYDMIKGPKQPEGPYLLNLKAQVAHLAATRNNSQV
ncbi:MAG: MBL fold metallo-hydrolase [Candidatus Saccharibacteria bacterium]